jgi:hypothetical protein
MRDDVSLIFDKYKEKDKREQLLAAMEKEIAGMVSNRCTLCVIGELV